MIGKTTVHYEILEKFGEARLLVTCIGELSEVSND